MKNIFKMFAAITMAMVMGFSMAACSSDSDSDDGGNSSGGSGNNSGSVSLGDELVLEGQVYTFEMSYEGILSGGDMVAYSPYIGSKKITSKSGGSGQITGGKLSFRIGIPTDLEPFGNFSLDEDSGDLGADITIEGSVEPSDVLGSQLILDNLSKENMSMKMDMQTMAMDIAVDAVSYTYVDKDCTVTIKEGNAEGIKIQKATFNLKKGWNVTNSVMKATTGGGMVGTMSGTMVTKPGDLATTKWVLSE